MSVSQNQRALDLDTDWTGERLEILVKHALELCDTLRAHPAVTKTEPWRHVLRITDDPL